jgi:hypothetical protein
MGNDVFANGREISCKAADGKSICAFPDVCMTPPENPATPPGVPVPYPNTGFAKDTTSGSKTVKITGKEVMLKNKSYFKKSTGDEAGSAAKKGAVTSVNRGKVYFTAWSMDVKAEGENVVRHLDMTTHNHASVPGNSLTWPYFDSMGKVKLPKSCKDDAKKITENCPNSAISRKTHHDCPNISSKKTVNAGYKNDPCIKAKRCMLVPYDRAKSLGGCCPGQTPHHLIPEHHFHGVSGYNAGQAPCVCAEGHSWHRDDPSPFNKRDKTHADLHDLQNSFERDAIDIIEDRIANGKTTEGRTPNKALNYFEAREGGIEAHSQTFGDSKCNEDCLEAQLDAYHKQKGIGMQDIDLLATKKYGKDEEPGALYDAVSNKVVAEGIFKT